MGQGKLSHSRVQVPVGLLPVRLELQVLCVVQGRKDGKRNKVSKFLPFLSIEGHVPGHHEVGVEAGEAVPGRTDGHVGEHEVSDGESLCGKPSR